MESLWPVCFTASDHVSSARPDDGVTHALFVYYVLCAVRWSRGLQLGRATTSRASCNNPAPKFYVFPSGRHQATPAGSLHAHCIRLQCIQPPNPLAALAHC